MECKADVDGFSFNGEIMQVVDITMDRDSGSVIPEILLYAPDGTLEASAGNWSYSHAEIIDHQLLQTGIYTIVAKDYEGNNLGSYRLTLFVAPIEETDADGVSDECDNCIAIPNGPLLGTCTVGIVGYTCHANVDCGTGGFCSMNQEDTDGDGRGDACDNDGCICDVSDDGNCTPQDALCSFQVYLGICPTACGICEAICCDVTGDGNCTPADALCRFQEYLAIHPNCFD
jgi:hypothetical protein